MEELEYTDGLYRLRAICKNHIADFEARKVELLKNMENCSPELVEMYQKSIEHCDKFIAYYENKYNSLKAKEKANRAVRYRSSNL